MTSLFSKYYFAKLIYSSDRENEEKGTNILKEGCSGTQFDCLLVHLLLNHTITFDISHLCYYLVLE